MTSSALAAVEPECYSPKSKSKANAGAAQRWPSSQVSIFLVALVIPWALTFGSLAVSPPRLVLLALTLPCLVSLFSGKAGPVRAVDILLLVHCLWCAVAIGVVHGAGEAVEGGGMLFIETFGAYLLGRCYIRSNSDFQAVVRLFFITVACMLPFALAEALTGSKVILQIFSTVLPSVQPTYTVPRMGLMRVQGPFEHPILFGVFCAAATALTYLVLGRDAGIVRRWAMTGAVALTAFLSLSSGPMVTVLVQIALLAWNGMLGKLAARWRILWVLGITGYAGVELLSNQSVPLLLTRYAFDPWTAFYRLLIFEYGWASIMAHPWFGTGFNDWIHPAWMTSSIDMFWLVPAVRHGLPAAVLFLAAFLVATVGIGLKASGDERVQACRTAYLICMGGLFVAGCTVHFWMATYMLFLFLVGSGMWLLDGEPRADAPGNPEVPVATGKQRRPRPTGSVRYARTWK